MNTTGLLDQLLKSGPGLLQGRQGAASTSGSPLEGLLSGGRGGMLGAGALGLLLGNKKLRNLGGSALGYGGMAALGVAAFKAYQNWQKAQGGTPKAEPRTLDRVPPAQAEQHSSAVLRAVIGAAKADGHIDDRERQLIDGEITKLTDDLELQAWFDQELNKPLDPADIAGAAQTPEMAAEMYLASLLVVDEQNHMERSYLDELARRLQLPPVLKAELESQAKAP